MKTLIELPYRERVKPDVQSVTIRLEMDQYDKLNKLCSLAAEQRGKYTSQGKLIGALIDKKWEEVNESTP